MKSHRKRKKQVASPLPHQHRGRRSPANDPWFQEIVSNPQSTEALGALMVWLAGKADAAGIPEDDPRFGPFTDTCMVSAEGKAFLSRVSQPLKKPL